MGWNLVRSAGFFRLRVTRSLLYWFPQKELLSRAYSDPSVLSVSKLDTLIVSSWNLSSDLRSSGRFPVRSTTDVLWLEPISPIESDNTAEDVFLQGDVTVVKAETDSSYSSFLGAVGSSAGQHIHGHPFNITNKFP